ncbi:MAG: winged helix DNA-binding domain-containing protein [Candidatus Poribacteria bacterium]|nr:winged helix DNA-binding domain-containing protein [Candidatus Poribacteria bacterium]
MKISASTARRLILQCQGLDGGWNLSEGKERAAQTIERLGYVQIDTIAVIARAHHHTLWSRYSDYAPKMLHELFAQDHRIFEYWTHAASYVPTRDYQYYLPRMRGLADRPKTRQWLQQNAQLVQNVLKRIQTEGPLGATNFSDTRNRKRGSWWDWKPAKRALETLFDIGELMVTERRNFQRIYDLTERVLLAETDTTEPSPDELARFIVHRTLATHGVASSGEIGWRNGNRSALVRVVDALVDSGEVTAVQIEGMEDVIYYALTEKISVEPSPCQNQKLIHFLSPFDNLVIRRERLKKLFGFEYKLECYLPVEKRRYGYFCLPILWGDEFVGRLDAKADRKRKTFIVRKVIFEQEFENDPDLLPVLAGKLWTLARFNNCESIVIEAATPGTAKIQLVRELDGVN